MVVALEGICGLTRAGWMVRHNASQAKVTMHLEDEDGSVHEVQWRRKQKTQGWTVDGVKSDRGIPENLHEVLRMDEIQKKTGTGSFNVHFASQKDPIFLLNDTGSHRAEFFTAAGDAQLLLGMKQKLKSKKKEANVRLTHCESELKISESRIETLREVPDVVRSVNDLSSRREVLLEDCEKISQLFGVRQKLLLAEKEQNQVQERFDSLSLLPAVPETEDLLELQSGLSDIKNCERILSALSQKIEAMNLVPNPPDIEEIVAFEEFLAHMTELGSNFRQAEETCEVLQVLPEQFPEVADNSLLESQIALLDSRTSDWGKRNEEFENIKSELESVQSSWSELLKKNPKCPTCGTVLDNRHLEGLHDKA